MVIFVVHICIINIQLLLFSIRELQEHFNSDARGPICPGMHHGIEKVKQVMCQSLELKIEIEKNNSIATAIEELRSRRRGYFYTLVQRQEIFDLLFGCDSRLNMVKLEAIF